MDIHLTSLTCLFVFQAAVMSIAFKEGLTVPPPAVNEIILAANQDIRQVNLSYWVSTLTHCVRQTPK